MEKTFTPLNRKIISNKPHHLREHQREHILVRKASPEDLQEIYHIACTVGKAQKNPYQGFLVDDYASDPRHYKEQFKKAIFELEHFYVAAIFDRLLGFLMAYTKDQWLKYNEKWLEEVVWHPNFDLSKTKNFILVGKTAIRAHLTNRGIGSKLYARLIEDVRSRGFHNILAETVIDSVPNFASLSFRKKQNYSLAGIRYGEYRGEIITDLIYHKPV
ncbi:MAG: GNAT family N-acetyltransferase [Thermovirgaceae bacterium]|nr:GNAT family N-acetyltransferase [Thermovirgaceae bacterium]